MIQTILACAAVAVLGVSGVAFGQQQGGAGESKPMWVYVGGPGPKSKGIYVSKFDAGTGELSEPVLAATLNRGNYFWLHPNGKCLYSVDQVEIGGKPRSIVRAYGIESGTGKLIDLNWKEAGGSGPCYVSLDSMGRFALVANYGSGGVAVLPIRLDGKVEEPSAVVQDAGSGPNPKRQNKPYAHCFDFDPSEDFALACDLGTDQINVYRVDKEHGRLTAVGQGKAPAGGGPRHLVFGKDGKFVYVINEMGCSVTAFAWDKETGGMTEVQTISTVPPDYHQSDKDTGAEVFVHPNGKWLYASTRGHDSVVRYLIGADGKLSEPKWISSGGKIPRYFGIDPTGRWMLIANEGSSDVLVHKIDPTDGTLTPTGGKIEVGSAMCVKFLVE